MTEELAFVGDVHGNLQALQGLWGALVRRRVPRVIFLGDYINKGPQSAEVLQELINYSESANATLLAGNHETALLDAIDREDLSGFLKMGGAMTVRSYIGGRVGPDVFAALMSRLPSEHLQALRAMPLVYETEQLIAEHIPSGAAAPKFRVSAHISVGELPRIGQSSAELDTGCGTDSGRLTALIWPSCDYIQVNDRGVVVSQ